MIENFISSDWRYNPKESRSVYFKALWIGKILEIIGMTIPTQRVVIKAADESSYD